MFTWDSTQSFQKMLLNFGGQVIIGSISISHKIAYDE